MQAIDPDGSRTLATLPPGGYIVSFASDWGGMHLRPGAEVAFTDAAGVHWIRRASGAIEEIADEAIAHYGIDLPVDWAEPDPAA